MTPFIRKLARPEVWERILRERLSEPLHLNVIAFFVSLFGSFQSKVYFDLVIRQHNAFCLLHAANFAKRNGYHAITAVEFGVANGAGLMNMAAIAAEVTKATGVEIDLVGFDAGTGMPPPLDYRDHPDCYGVGDFPMQDYDMLRQQLPANVGLVIGNLKETVPTFTASLRADRPLAYVVMDVDYYSSTVDALEIFNGPAEVYLPETMIYLDDISFSNHNPWQGEYLAVNEFNDRHPMRKACRFNFLAERRLFKRAIWVSQIYIMHILDHDLKSRPRTGNRLVQGNPYLKMPTVN